MAEQYPSDAELNALSGTTQGAGILVPEKNKDPHYVDLAKVWKRLADAMIPLTGCEVYKDGDLTFAVRAGKYLNGDTEVNYAGAATQALTDNTTNYIYLTAAGVLTVNTTGFPTSSVTPHVPLATIVTASGNYSIDDGDINGLYRQRSMLRVCGSVSGDVYTADSAAKIIGYINGTGGYARAREGDTVEVAYNAAAYDCTSVPLDPRPGVTINGLLSGGVRPTIEGQIVTDCGGDYRAVNFSNFIIDSSGLDKEKPAAGDVEYGANHLQDGLFILDGVEFTGDNHATGGNMLTFVAQNHPCHGRMTACHVEEPYNDCISTKAASTALGDLSSLVLRDCEGNNTGSVNATDNCLTAHHNFRIWDYNGYYHTPEYTGADPYIIASENDGSKIYLHNTKTVGGRVYVSGVVDGCDVKPIAAGQGIGIHVIGTDSLVINNRITDNNGTGNTGAILVAAISARIIGNRSIGFDRDVAGAGYSIKLDSTCTGSIQVIGNVSLDCRRPIINDINNAAVTVEMYDNHNYGTLANDVENCSPCNTVINTGGNYFVKSVTNITLDEDDVTAPPENLRDAIADPGDAGAISVTKTGTCPLVTTGAETRTLAIPPVVGRTISLPFKTDGGDCVITVASGVNVAGNTVLTFNALGQHIMLKSVEVGAALAWRVVCNDGVGLA